MTNTTGHRVLIAPVIVLSALLAGGCAAVHSGSASDALEVAPPAQAPAPPAPQAPAEADRAPDVTSGSATAPVAEPDSPEAVAQAAGMSPDQVAGYCRQAGDLNLWGVPAEIGSPANFRHGADIVSALTPFTPATMKSDVALIYNDYTAIATTRRVYVQVKGELDPAFGRVMDFRHSICDQS